MFQWVARLFSSGLHVPFLIYIFVIIVAIVVRIIVAKNIADRGDLILTAKGYDAEEIDLRSLALWVCFFLGVILCFVIVFWYVGTFPTVKATNDFYSEMKDKDDDMTQEEKAVLSVYRTLKEEDKDQIKKALNFMYKRDSRDDSED